MEEYTVRYWFGAEESGVTTAFVSESIQAGDIDEVTRRVKDRMSQPLFAIDSEGYGRVVVNSNLIRFCSILVAARTAEPVSLAVEGEETTLRIAQAVATPAVATARRL